MTAFVLDNSVVMRWCFEGAANPYAESVMQKLTTGHRAFAPVLWHYEVVAVLAKAQRGGTFTQQEVTDFLNELMSFPITIDHEGTALIFTDVHRLAVTYCVTGYDAAYLELALRKNLPLASLDDELRKACVRAGGALFPA